MQSSSSIKDEKNIFLIGGGEIVEGETYMIDQEIMSSIPQDGSLVFFGVAAGDAEGYGAIIKDVFGVQCKVTVVREVDGAEFAYKAIKNADVIYLGGGETKLLLDLFEKWQLIEVLKSVIDRGVYVVGMSAGAQALSTWYVHEESETQEIRRGWGVVNGTICVLVHATEESYKRARETCRQYQATERCIVYGIGEGTAVLTNADGIESVKVGDGELWT